MQRKRTCAWLIVCLTLIVLPRVFASPQSSNLTELESGWNITSASNISGDEALISQSSYDASRWYAVKHMPATVLQVLEDNGVYKNLYEGMNLTAPGDLWKQDWWYRTTFSAPAGRDVYSLVFRGINYRADIWLNGHKIADSSQVVGMYDSFEFDVTKFIRADGPNVLAVKVTPERGLLSEDGVVVGDHTVELADSWLDWINWKYIGYHDPEHKVNIPFVPDRNAGIWKRPLPALSPAALTVYCDLRNHSEKPVSGILHGEISRAGKSTIAFENKVTLRPSETAEVAVTPSDVAQLSVADPELWWPYRWGRPNLYHLKMDFISDGKTSDTQEIDFGIRKITQARDQDNSFPEIGSGGGNFYLQINGRDYLIRGAAYTPDLLFENDPDRDAAMISYVKDLGLNLIRWELKIADETMIERADREGVPVMLGWMCCTQWEHWNLWSAEDQWVARASLRARLNELRSHPAVVLWANGSDGLPPDPILNDYHEIEKELHWQNAIVDTVADRNRSWSGIHMEGPYVWRPPYYWFSDVYGPARGSSADHLWPPDDYWYFHAGGNEGGNNTLANIRRALNQRYGPTNSAEELAKKAQLAYYEDVRAQYESYATHWSNRKMVMHWMMNSPWPSFFGHLFDYYFKQGGGYFGAKKAMLPVSVVWDYYATADRSTAHVYAVNQTAEPLRHVNVSLAFYNIDGTRKYANETKDLEVAPYSSVPALSVARIPGLSSTYFVRCRMSAADGSVLADNTYWESTTDDDLGSPKNDDQFITKLVKWADLSALDTMPRSEVTATSKFSEAKGEGTTRITLTNHSNHVAFFLRAEITKGANGEEVLPIIYDDNYITLYPHEARTLVATFAMSASDGRPVALRVEGYNLAKKIVTPSQ